MNAPRPSQWRHFPIPWHAVQSSAIVDFLPSRQTISCEENRILSIRAGSGYASQAELWVSVHFEACGLQLRTACPELNA